MTVHSHRLQCVPLATLVLVALAGRGRACDPVPIAIANAGFEADIVGTNCYQVFPTVTGWTNYDPNNILQYANNVVGGINAIPGSVYFPGGVPEGEHAAIVFLQGTIGAGPAGLTQVLAETLQPDTTYTLTAQIGDIASGQGPPPCDVYGYFHLDGFPGYRVQLLAGGVVIAEDDNALAGVLDDGLFALSTTQVSIGPSHPQLGQPLEIRLINLNQAETPEDPGVEVDFDDVQLIAQPNPLALPANFDNDCDVDFADFAQFAPCVAGPDMPLPPGNCPIGPAADLDGDTDADLADLAEFMLQFTGET